MRSLLLAVLVCFGAYSTASAQTGRMLKCRDHDGAVYHLWSRHGELRRVSAIDVHNQLVEIFVSEDGTWTLLITFEPGKTCLIGSGENWQEWESEPPTPEQGL